ncbi:MAG: glycosyltransferase [Pseudomonadota bacterium]|nr:glycosyltransferase [Pseudomonadota bacterium]
MSISSPVVSVVTPTYNRAGFLLQAIESVLQQTFGDFELIVVDDGSTDDTPQLMDRYLQDTRVRYFKQSNQGQSVARNRGIKEAQGEYICFLDSDNAWHEDKLEKSLEAFRQNPGFHVVYGDYMVIDAEGNELGVNQMRRYTGRVTAHLLKDNFVSMNTTMTRRNCFREMGGFDEKDRLAEDYGLWLRFSTRYRFYYLDQILGYYRVMNGQISSDKARRLEANERLLKSFLAEYPDSVSASEKRRGLSHFYARKARHHGSSGEAIKALADSARSLSLDPFWPAPWKALAKSFFRSRLR